MPIPFQILPILTEDASRMDWKNAQYRSSVRVQYGKASVENNIGGASQLESLVVNGLGGMDRRYQMSQDLVCKDGI